MTRAERFEGALLVVILLVVGLAAGAASFTHVHDWTMANVPPGTPDAFGWVNACVSELVPVAALLEIRRRRRAGKGVRYPLALLFGAAGLSLAAQLAVAVQTVAGWLLSAVPMLAFTALTKLVLGGKPAAASTAAPVAVAVPDPAPAVVASVPARPRPALVPDSVRMLPIVARVAAPASDTLSAPPTTAERVAAALSEAPSATPAQIAARLAISERTVRRYLPADSLPTRRRAVPAPG